MRIHLCILLGALSLTACKGDEVVDSDTGEEIVDDGVSPVVTDASAQCLTFDEGSETEYEQWSFTAKFDDPQGPSDVPRSTLDKEDLEDQHRVSWGQDGQVLNEVPAIVCDPNAGECLGTLQASLYSLPCSSATEWTFEIFIVDLDGNQGSDSVQGEKG